MEWIDWTFGALIVAAVCFLLWAGTRKGPP